MDIIGAQKPSTARGHLAGHTPNHTNPTPVAVWLQMAIDIEEKQ